MARTKEEHISYWIKGAEEDLDTAEFLIAGRRWLYGLFLCHLAIEKLCKAIWIKNKTENIPPKTHNLLRLLAEAGLTYSDGILDTLNKLNEYQIEGRYPGELTVLNSSTSGEIAMELLEKTKQVKEWLLNNLR